MQINNSLIWGMENPYFYMLSICAMIWLTYLPTLQALFFSHFSCTLN